ncbi:MAG TPA: hypothetical protein V6D17_10815 [Candidatus Obscuribacterales bacterium]
MIKFKITGTLPAPWEDFISLDHPRYPHFTLMTRKEAEGPGGVEDSDGSDGWVDRTLDVESIDEETARRTIAEALAVPADDIVIEQEGWCRSV